MEDTFTIENIKAMEADIAKALQAVEKKYGVTIKYDSPNTFHIYATKLALEITKPMPFEAEYRRVADKYGLQTDWIGQSFWIPGEASYRIIGFDSGKESVVIARLNKAGKNGKLCIIKPTKITEAMTSKHKILERS